MSAILGAITAAGSFAEGYMKGKDKVEQQERERQAFAQQRELAELSLKRARDEEAMRQELKLVDAKPTPTEVFKVITPDGPVVYADEKLAKEHFNQVVGSGGELRKSYSVSGKMFDSEDEAKAAVEAMSTPAATARRKAEIAEKYANPQLAAMYQQNYEKQVNHARNEMKQRVLEAQARGDVNAVATMFNDEIHNGIKGEAHVGPDGSITIVKTKNGQELGQQTFASADEFWSKTIENISATPDNMAEMWKAKQGLRLQERQIANQKAYQDATLKQGDRGLDIQRDVADANIKNQAGMLGVAQQNAGTAASQVGLGYAQLQQPKVHSGIDDKGNVTFGATQTPYDPKTKTFGLKIVGVENAEGMKPTPRGTIRQPSALDQLLMGGQQPGFVMPDFSKLPPKNIGGATK